MNQALIGTAHVCQSRLPRLLLNCAVVMLLSKPACSATTVIQSPEQARQLGLESLRLAVKKDGGAPLPTELDKFVKDRKAAVALGKALFWDMQVGSDGVQACASCHFHAGTDNRIKNVVNPGFNNITNLRQDNIIGYLEANIPTLPATFETAQPNQTITREDFPLVKTIEDYVVLSDGSIAAAPGNSNDIIGPMGIIMAGFNGVQPGIAVELGSPLADPVFNVGGFNVRQVKERNTPTVINSVFNFANFWDGSANHYFNGIGVLGIQNPDAKIYVNQPKIGLVQEKIDLNNGSLASQALLPPLGTVEMSYGNANTGLTRHHWEIGYKLLRPAIQTGLPLVPLGEQQVLRHDSVLGHLVNEPFRGLHTSYEKLIKQAFAEQYWNSPQNITSTSKVLPNSSNISAFSQMEANFGLFFGLAIEMYEATLVADRTPFDQWMETGRFNQYFGKKQLAGLNLFVNEGQCIKCHAGPELTKASIRSAQGGKDLIRAMQMAQGEALYDNGYYNTSVTPTTDDMGRGSIDGLINPFAFSRQASNLSRDGF